MSRIIEAKAVISAEDKTGNVFDKIAAKFKGLEKSGKAIEKLKATPFSGNLGEELDRLKLTEKELQKVRKSYAAFHETLSRAGPGGGKPKAEHYFRAINDWKGKTVDHWREVKAAVDDTEKSHQKLFRSAGRFALHAAGIGGGAYVAGHAVKSGAVAAAERAREMARYSLGGLTDDEKARANAKADEVSGKVPSVGRTEVLGHIRQLRARLGDFDHAIDNVETLTKAQVVLGTLGHGESAPEDLEKLVLGLESQGIGSQPEKFKTYMNAFVRAKSLFPDLRGEDFRQYMKTANASKYGLSEDYLTGVAPTMMQHEGASNFGVMQASAFSALVGKRQTKASQAAMRKYGLLDDNNNLLNESAFIKDPYKWAEANIVPALEKHGVKTDEEHRGDVVKAMTQMFSNRKVGEFFASMLVNRGIIDKDRALLPQAKGTEGAANARSEDPFVAWGAVTNQLKDAGTALISLKPSVALLNDAATALSNFTQTLQSGKPPDGTIARQVYDAAHSPIFDKPNLEQLNERNLRDRLETEMRETDQKLAPSYGLDEKTARQLRQRRFDLQSGIDRANNQASMPPIYSQKELDDWMEVDRERRRGEAYSTMPSFGRGGVRGVPLPRSRPAEADAGAMPPVQSLEGANVQATLTGSAVVEGEAKLSIFVQASSMLEALVSKMESAVKLVGSLSANGPGSTGKSSPDAAAPATGVGGQ